MPHWSTTWISSPGGTCDAISGGTAIWPFGLSSPLKSAVFITVSSPALSSHVSEPRAVRAPRRGSRALFPTSAFIRPERWQAENIDKRCATSTNDQRCAIQCHNVGTQLPYGRHPASASYRHEKEDRAGGRLDAARH